MKDVTMIDSDSLKPGRVYLVPKVATSEHHVVPLEGFDPEGHLHWKFEGFNATSNTSDIIATKKWVRLGL